MSKQAVVGALCLVGVLIAALTLPHGAPSTSTDPRQIARMTEQMLPGARVPVGFVGTLGMANRLVVLEPPGQNVTLLALGKGGEDELIHQVGGTPERTETCNVTIGNQTLPARKQLMPGIIRYVVLYRGVAILVQGPPDDFPEKAWQTFLAGLSAR